MADSPYYVLQCQNENCQFRFPEDEVQSRGHICPLCSAQAQKVAAFVPGDHLVSDTPFDRPRVEALLDNIRSIHNVGSVFRTCDAAGISALHLGGITASGDHPRMAKAALGAQLMVPWTHCRNGLERTIRLKKKGFRPWAVETSANGQPLFDFQPEVDDNPILLVVGNERAGIDPDILRLCERVLSIPMEGHKRSLNVAVAFGIAAYFVRHILPGAARGA